MIIIAETKQENALVEQLAKEHHAEAWKREDSFAIVRWSREDLMGVKPELNEKEAEAFLEYYESNIKNLVCGEGFKTLEEMDASDFVTEEKSILAKTIARDIVHDGTTNTGSGTWIVYFDEVQDKYKVDLSEDEEMLEAITEELHNSYEEKIAEISVLDDAIDLTFYLDFCPNAEE